MKRSGKNKDKKCVLSIDVGLLNLAVCCVHLNDDEGDILSQFDILLWELINVVGGGSDIPEGPCKYLVGDRNCKRKGTCLDGDGLLCKQHAKACNVAVPVVKKIQVKNINMQDIVLKILNALDDLCYRYHDLLQQVDSVVIEKQPMENKKMQMVSHIVYAHFIRFYNGRVPVTLLPAYHKLSVYDGPTVPCTLKTKYAQRKFLGVQYTVWFLENKVCDHVSWMTLFKGQSKKDDLADAFLQGLFSLVGVAQVDQDGSSGGTPRKVRKYRKKKLHF